MSLFSLCETNTIYICIVLTLGGVPHLLHQISAGFIQVFWFLPTSHEHVDCFLIIEDAVRRLSARLALMAEEEKLIPNNFIFFNSVTWQMF